MVADLYLGFACMQELLIVGHWGEVTRGEYHIRL